MAQNFDPAKEIEILLSETGFSWLLSDESSSFEKARDLKVLGNYAQDMLTNVIYGWLVGLEERATPVLQRAYAFFEAAIADDEEG